MLYPGLINHFMNPRKGIIAPSKESSKLHDTAVPRLDLYERSVLLNIPQNSGMGTCAAFGLPRVLDYPSSTCLEIYWPNSGVNSSPAGRGMLTAKLDFLRLSNIKRMKGSSFSWQGFHTLSCQAAVTGSIFRGCTR